MFGVIMEKIPMEWVDKIFNCLNQFYGAKWVIQFDKFYPESLAKTAWQAALQGATYDEIRYALVLLKQNSTLKESTIPNYLEFYRYAKRLSYPKLQDKIEPIKGDPEIAKRSLDEIRSKLKYGHVKSEGL